MIAGAKPDEHAVLVIVRMVVAWVLLLLVLDNASVAREPP
jgi:hypothetical protein